MCLEKLFGSREGEIAAKAEAGIDINKQTSDALSDFRPEDFDVVISLC
ncbi:MAG: hypothetical protein QNJ38_18715 [Prochloraceae cyanobacterium]|nr:hypothetical protein [Prochloraceae cyanobacterium]